MIYIESMGATEKSQSTKKHFRKKLEKEFGDLLQFEDLLNNNNKRLVPTRNLSRGLNGQIVTLSQQLDKGILHL